MDSGSKNLSLSHSLYDFHWLPDSIKIDPDGQIQFQYTLIFEMFLKRYNTTNFFTIVDLRRSDVMVFLDPSILEK